MAITSYRTTIQTKQRDDITGFKGKDYKTPHSTNKIANEVFNHFSPASAINSIATYLTQQPQKAINAKQSQQPRKAINTKQQSQQQPKAINTKQTNLQQPSTLQSKV